MAHCAVHEKHVRSNGRAIAIAGIAEVCVHPGHRGRGHVQALLQAAHAFGRQRGWEFAVLFGKAMFYTSSGYECIDNVYPDTAADTGASGGPSDPSPPYKDAMVCPLQEAAWPRAGRVVLPGPDF